MKNIYVLTAVVILSVSALAQSPEKMSYQAVVRDANDDLISNQAVGMQISILQGSAGGAAVYTEIQNPTTNANGLVSIEIGAGTTSDNFSAIDWAHGPYFIKTETDPSGGTNYSITGTSQLTSVPYALHAKTAENVIGGIFETDPVFGESVAGGITEADTTNWNNHTVDTDTQLDSAGVAALGFMAGGITETDPVFGESIAKGITATDTTNWSNKLSIEIDGSVTNEIQDLQLIKNSLMLTEKVKPTSIDLSPYLDAAFTTIGTTTSNASGNYTTDDFVFGSPQMDDDGDTNHDYRMFFDKSTGAFRVGHVNANQWDQVKRGIKSVAMGADNTASGNTSTAMGLSTAALGDYSTAMGLSSSALGFASTAMSFGTTASGDYS
ncbi:MAG: hypothetical protein KAK04_04365, partial [Cyclobacteriaceae bacterium]|nr:hypothetical protein [Cyclobacteriaceae bacterium]